MDGDSSKSNAHVILIVGYWDSEDLEDSLSVSKQDQDEQGDDSPDTTNHEPHRHLVIEPTPCEAFEGCTEYFVE
jgi:hypothetical protein